MTDLLPAGVLADLVSITTETMTHTATVARTSTVVACKVGADNATTVRIHGLPPAVGVTRWMIRVPQGTDVRVADSITVKDPAGLVAGTYSVLTIDGPSSPYSVDTLCRCVLTKTATGGWPIVTNASVQFRNPTNQALPLLSAAVFIDPISYDTRLGDVAAEFSYTVTFDPTLTYSDGTTTVAAGHEIIWSRLRTPRHATPLHRLRSVDTPVPLASAVIKDAD